jgi:EmrB/QacA subfamily drug resistance transporter
MGLQYKYAAALTISIALFMAVLDSTIVNVSLVAMERDFGTTISTIQWVVTAYILAQAAVIPVSGYLANRIGIKFLFLAALAVFTLGSLLCGLSRDVASGTNAEHLLIAVRVVQAVGGGMLIPLGMSMVFAVFPPEERAAASALVSVPMLFAPAFGPTIGGLIVDSRWEWPAIFYINVPIGIVAFALIVRILKPDERRVVTGTADARGFDVLGLILSMVGAVVLIYGFVLVGEGESADSSSVHGWGYWPVWAFIGAGLVCLAVFAYVELKVAADPVLDLRLFAHRDFRNASYVTFGTRAVIYGGFLLIPLFLQQYRGVSAVHTGLIMTGQGIGAILGIQTASRFYDRLGPRILVVVGIAVVLISTIGFTQVGQQSDWQFFGPLLFIRGIGYGWLGLPLQTVALGAITGRGLPKASSLYNATAQIFSSIGTALVTTLLVQRTAVQTAALETKPFTNAASLALAAATAAMSDVFIVLALGTVAVLLVSFLLPRFSLRVLRGRQAAASPEPAAQSAIDAAGSLH